MRFYRFILRVFPARFRDRFGDDMVAVFRDRLAAARKSGLRAVVALWMSATADLLAHGLAERRKRSGTGGVARGTRAVLQDVRYALRSFRRRPGFTAVALVTLALGIGANTAIFSVVHALLLRPLPYPDGHRIVQLYGTHRVYQFTRGSSNPFDFDYLEHRTQTLAFLSTTRIGRTTLTGAGEPAALGTVAVMPSFFDIMQVWPAVGSTFTVDQARAGDAVVILSDALWTNRFGGRADIVGATIMLDDRPAVVAGVMPKNFQYPARVDIWRPMSLSAKERADLGSWYFGVIARLKPGVAHDVASQELDRFAAELARAHPKQRGDRGFKLVGLQADLASRAADGLRLLQGVVLVVLLIACANIANLLLAQASGRAREIGVRSALGASRGRLIRQWLTESVVLSLGGALVGVLMAIVAVPVLVALAPPFLLPADTPIGVSWPVLLITGLTAVVTGILFGLAPAIVSTSSQVTGALKDGARAAVAGLTFSRRQWLRASLVAAEVALALVLLVGAGLLVRSFAMLLRQSPGVVSDRVLTAQVSLPPARYKSEELRRQFWQTLVERLGSVAGVEVAAGANALPFSLWEWQSGFRIDGRDVPNDGAGIRAVTPEIFHTLGIPIVRGRAFTLGDTVTSEPVAIVSDEFVRQFLPGLDPIGQRLSHDENNPRWATIVGVVGSTRHVTLTEAPRAEMYFPVSQYPAATTMLVALKTARDPLAFASAVRDVVHTLDPALPVVEVKTLDDLLDAKRAQPRFAMTLMTFFAALAGALALTGIGGVMAYLIGQGRREIGIRLALGARAAQVQGDVIRRGLLVVSVGIGVGVLAALWLTRLLETELFAITPADPPAFVMAATTLFLAATMACWLPAARVSRVDAARVLRE